MQIHVCKSKIHRATVTEANLGYKGSITIDSKLLEASGMYEYEKVQVVNINNGQRVETYIIEGREGEGDICLNGAMARKGQVGDKLIIISYGIIEEKEVKSHLPKIVYVDENNQIIEK